jgi:uncharacterized protein (DUF1697 family)
MIRYIAFLRAVNPVNASMPALRSAFEQAGFTRVRTVLGSGNVAFDAAPDDEHRIEQIAEAAMAARLGKAFPAIVRSRAYLQELLAADVHARHGIPPEAKRVVSFLREAAEPRVALPLARDLASVFLVSGREVYSAYLPTPKGPVFMQLIERAFGTDLTTRTLDTVARCARA